VYIGRPSPLGNPFVIGRDGDRAEIIRKYERWLIDRIFVASITPQKLAFLSLVDAYERGEALNLECHCAPLPCHGDVIKKLILDWH
jgi:Domain of unknown function (DUF4326)